MLIDRVKLEEGFRSHPYKDSRGFLTIGYGFDIDPSGPGLAEDESTAVLQIKLNKVANSLRQALPWTSTLDTVRFEVLVDMAYNMGLNKLVVFKKTLAAIQSGDFEKAAQEMLESKWAEEVGARAHKLASIMRSGVDNG